MIIAGLWLALVLPADLRDLNGWLAFSIPLEGLILLGLVLWLPERLRRRVLPVVGVLLGAGVVLRIFDLGFDAVFDRPLDLITDWTYLGSGLELISYDYGWWGAGLVVIGALAGVLGVLLVMPLAVGRLEAVTRRHRHASVTVFVVLSLVWVTASAGDWHTSRRTPVAAHEVIDATTGRISQSRESWSDRERFAREIATDPFAQQSAQLLGGLRGKDVVVVFVESYGEVALADPEVSPGVTSVLGSGETQLATAGMTARSAYLESPTFGAASWLAHSTLQSGLWVNSQQRYNRLLLEQRLTLTEAFSTAGWRTVTYAPAITKPWPEGERFYNFDELVRGADLDYDGDRFGFDSVPDQYTLAKFANAELAEPSAGRQPVMAEINLISSHHPWTPVPRLVDWTVAADPAAYADQSEGQLSQRELFDNSEQVRTAYGTAVEYSLGSVVSFIEAKASRDLVVLVVGDHQPHSYVSGPDASRRVPVSLIAGDPTVLAAIDHWGWQEGLVPDPADPARRMDVLRDQLLSAFSAPN